MLDILPNAESPAYSSLSDYRPLHVYIIHDQITIHLQLTYAELSTYSVSLLSLSPLGAASATSVP